MCYPAFVWTGIALTAVCSTNFFHLSQLTHTWKVACNIIKVLLSTASSRSFIAILNGSTLFGNTAIVYDIFLYLYYPFLPWLSVAVCLCYWTSSPVPNSSLNLSTRWMEICDVIGVNAADTNIRFWITLCCTSFPKIVLPFPWILDHFHWQTMLMSHVHTRTHKRTIKKEQFGD